MRPSGELVWWLAVVLSLTAGSRGDLFDVISELPSCGTACISSAIGDSSCGADAACICSDKALYKNAQSCIIDKCPVLEALEVARIEADACQRPRRSRRRDLLIPLCIEIPAFFFPWLRTYSRATTSEGLAPDDWMMVVCGLLFTVFIVLGQYTGMTSFGVDTFTVDPDVVTYGLKLFYVAETLYFTVLCLTKVSVLSFYLRIFPHQRFRWCAYAAMALVVIPGIIFVFVQVFQCIPIRYAWEAWLGQGGDYHCVNLNMLAYTAASFSVVQDVIILLLPLPWLFGLNINTRAKAGIIIMFSLGIFILATSCVRLRFIINFGHTTNPSWDFTDAFIWSALEVTVSIIVACLPAIRVLLVSEVPRIMSTFTRGAPRTTRGGYVMERSAMSSSGARGMTGGSRQRRSVNIFGSKDRDEDGGENESQIELGLQLGDKIQGEVQTQISGQRDSDEVDNSGIRIKTTTTTHVDVNG